MNSSVTFKKVDNEGYPGGKYATAASKYGDSLNSVFQTLPSAEKAKAEKSMTDAEKESLKSLEESMRALSGVNIEDVKPHDIPKVIDTWLSSIDNFQNQIQDYENNNRLDKNKIGELKNQLKETEEATVKNVVDIIEKLEEEPELLEQVIDKINEQAFKNKNSGNANKSMQKTNLPQIISGILKEKYPKDKLNELKDKKEIAKKIDDGNNNAFFNPTSIKDKSKNELCGILNENNSQKGIPDDDKKTNPIKFGTFGALTISGRKPNGYPKQEFENFA